MATLAPKRLSIDVSEDMNGVVERLGGRLGGPEGGCERVAQEVPAHVAACSTHFWLTAASEASLPCHWSRATSADCKQMQKDFLRNVQAGALKKGLGGRVVATAWHEMAPRASRAWMSIERFGRADYLTATSECTTSGAFAKNGPTSLRHSWKSSDSRKSTIWSSTVFQRTSST